jgi:hypothetical protein
MKITKHISFYFLKDRIIYINNIIDETNTYEYTTDIFIHTNNIVLQKNAFNNYTNGCITIIYHDLSETHPFYLTWKCRDLLQQQQNDYDIFMYIEDDILVPRKSIAYWLEYNEKLIELNYNLGFIRIEVENNIEYLTNLLGEKFDTIINIDDKSYCVNNKNPYCAFWIYNKNEFNKFINSNYYNISNIPNYNTREKSAIGLHGFGLNWYKSTLIPIIDNKLIESCKIYHMPNNYVLNKNIAFGTIKFDEAIKFVQNDLKFIQNDVENNLKFVQNDIENNLKFIQNNLKFIQNNVENNLKFVKNNVENNLKFVQNNVENNIEIIQNKKEKRTSIISF